MCERAAVLQAHRLHFGVSRTRASGNMHSDQNHQPPQIAGASTRSLVKRLDAQLTEKQNRPRCYPKKKECEKKTHLFSLFRSSSLPYAHPKVRRAVTQGYIDIACPTLATLAITPIPRFFLCPFFPEKQGPPLFWLRYGARAPRSALHVVKRRVS